MFASSSPSLSSAISSPSSSSISVEDLDALSMQFFGQGGLDYLAGPLNAPPGPCSPTSDTFLENGPVANGPSLPDDSLSKMLASDASASSRASAARPVPKPLNLTLSAPETMDPAMDSSTIPSASMSMAMSDSPSPTRSASPYSTSVPPSPTSPSYDDILVPVVACANCKRSHIKCDHGRPCQNCLKHPSKAATCRDAVPKPRGRPKGGSKAAAAADAMYGGVRLQQHPGFQSFSGSTYLHLQGHAEQPYPHHLH
ncbi:hypothetical protein BGZ65_011489, partial [Modicella reniformis]